MLLLTSFMTTLVFAQSISLLLSANSGNVLDFTATVFVGTPPKPITVTFETGAYRTWVKSPLLNAASTTLVVSNITTFISPSSDINSQDAVGSIAHDNFIISSQSISNVSLVLATNKANTTSSNGQFGLAFTPEPAWGAYDPSLMVTVFKQKPSISKIISYWIDKSGQFGELNLGSMNASRYTGDLIQIPHKSIAMANSTSLTAPKTSDYLWSVGLLSIQAGSDIVAMPADQTAVLATGTSVAFLPKALLDRIATAINATLNPVDGRYIMPCAKLSSMPNITFTLNSDEGPVNFPLSPYAYSFSYNSQTNPGQCFLGLLASSDTTFQNSILLGNIFLKQYYTVFQFANRSIALGFIPRDSAAGSGGVGNTSSGGFAMGCISTFLLALGIYIVCL